VFREAHAAEPAETSTMVGDGPLLEQARRHAASLGLQDAGLAGAMGKAGRERALAHYSQEHTPVELADILARAARP
jgi:hypothetical protein